MRKILLSAGLILSCTVATHAQVFWTEDFNNGCTSGCDASIYVSPNGSWSQTLTGLEGTDPNLWYISCAENGHTNTICGSGCAPASPTATLASLHVGSNPNSMGDVGAAYDAGGLCGILTCPQTNRRIETPVINCTGQNTITLSFNYIETGAPPNDDASVWYFDGTTWALLINTPQTVICGSGQGQWTAFSVPLPASANNNPNVRIGFLWVNNDDGNGADPSFAVDDMTLSVPSGPIAPVAAFTASATSVCIGQAVNFTDISTGSPTSWSWTFPSGTPPSATTQNVNGITWTAAGTYSVTLTAANANGNSTATVVITVNPAPVVTASGNPTTICAGQQTTLTGGGAATYVWNPGPVTGSPVNVTPAATTTYTVTGTDANGCTGTAQVVISVTPCAVPVVNFSASDTTICVGDCINLTDLSTNNPTSWSWTFSGAATPTSAAQNPTGICYNAPGTFAVTLIAGNANGSGSLTKTGYITVNPPPAAYAGADVTICTGQQTVLNGSGGVGFLWQPGNQPTPSYTVTPAATTTYTLLVTDAIGCTASDQVVVTVQPCTVPAAAMSASQTGFCAGDCIDFTDNSTGTPTGWQWTFTGATPASSTQQNPTSICYNTAGTYTVTLIVTNAFGADTTTTVVTAGAAPTVDAGAAVSIAIGNQTTLVATGGTGTYVWSPTNGLGAPNSATTTASPTVTTTYTVTFTDANGCSDSDTVTVQVIEAYGLFIPSAFSPNNDGSNDMLFVYGAGIKTLVFVVYDRYGEIVFESHSVNEGWDGTLRGKPLNGGIFAWYCTIEYFDGRTETLKGDVTLMR
jgi:gliding motility-associated-like protein